MDEATARFVRERAGFRCEYCLLPERHVRLPFEIEHVVARQHGGTDALGNLAFACLHCNKRKGPNLTGLDRVAARAKIVRLFHPRHHSWGYHFSLLGPRIVGRTAIGRVTVDVLAMNEPLLVLLREELIEEGLFPG
ncbi:HNH endonuclease [Limnoglobus roseus]|uniref:HNH endonuclease n=1 Tax=Limnoglobus roseus TaxID=2598579 RepID=A0A5C1A4I1_9BACT|nr:HNH endonuclease signature motif containing protein [Limnoglobus roseus]QEL13560.1 HNH endonuclease [Limnoglobus roseus]